MTETDLMKKLAELIFLYRKKNRMTLQDLSDKTDITSKYLRSLELGENNPALASYFKAAKVLAIPPEEINKIIKNYLND